MRSIATAALSMVMWSACAPAEDPALEGGEVELPRACGASEECPEARVCEGGVCIGTAEDLASPDEIEGAVAAIVRHACERLHGECNDVCDNPFVECLDSAGACTESWTAEELDDFDDPLLDPVLAGHCAAQIDVAACTDLRPDTLECRFAVVDACPGDDDGYGAPYSPFHPAPIERNTTLSLRLCEDVVEYFALRLERGESLSVLVAEDQNLSLDLMQLRANASGEAVLDEVVSYVDPDGDPTAPVPDAGLYLLAVESSFASSRFELTVATQ